MREFATFLKAAEFALGGIAAAFAAGQLSNKIAHRTFQISDSLLLIIQLLFFSSFFSSFNHPPKQTSESWRRSRFATTRLARWWTAERTSATSSSTATTPTTRVTLSWWCGGSSTTHRNRFTSGFPARTRGTSANSFGPSLTWSTASARTASPSTGRFGWWAGGRERKNHRILKIKVHFRWRWRASTPVWSPPSTARTRSTGSWWCLVRFERFIEV